MHQPAKACGSKQPRTRLADLRCRALANAHLPSLVLTKRPALPPGRPLPPDVAWLPTLCWQQRRRGAQAEGHPSEGPGLNRRRP